MDSDQALNALRTRGFEEVIYSSSNTTVKRLLFMHVIVLTVVFRVVLIK